MFHPCRIVAGEMTVHDLCREDVCLVKDLFHVPFRGVVQEDIHAVFFHHFSVFFLPDGVRVPAGYDLDFPSENGRELLDESIVGFWIYHGFTLSCLNPWSEEVFNDDSLNFCMEFDGMIILERCRDICSVKGFCDVFDVFP